MKHMKAPLLTALTFALAGPAFGAIAFSVWGFALGDEPTGPVVAILATLWMLPFGYILGIVPAALTGLTVGLLGRRLELASYIALAVVAGAAMTVLVDMLRSASMVVTEGVVTLAVIGGLAGGLCGALSGVLGRRRGRAAAPTAG